MTRLRLDRRFFLSVLIPLGLLLAGCLPSTGHPAKPAGNVGSAFLVRPIKHSVRYWVRLDRIISPARPATAQFFGPTAGTRLVAAVFTIYGANHYYSADAESNATLIGSDSKTYTASLFDNVTGCPSFGSTFRIAPGLAATGCIVFDVPDDVGIARIAWTTTATATTFVWWKG